MTAALEYWPLLALPLLLAIAPWVRRRNWVRAARRHWSAHPSIERHSHDRPEAVHDPEEDSSMSTLAKLAQAGHAHAIVSELTRDPDPEPKHPYMRDRQSGAGNCICGAAERHRRHPHEFVPAMNNPQRCTCALPREAKCHQASHERGDNT